MGEWKDTALGEVAAFTNGFAFGPTHWGSRGLPIIRIEQMLDPEAEADRFDGPMPDRVRLDSGDLLMSWSGTIDIVKWTRGPALVNQHLFKVEPLGTVDSAFLFHLLRASLPQFTAASHGTTMKHIKRADLLSFRMRLPPETEQRRVAAVLDTLDTTITAAERLTAKLERERDGLREALLRDVADSGDWRESALQDLASAPICYGIVQSGRHDPNGVPVVTIGDLTGDFANGLHRATREIEAQYTRSRIRPGDVLLSVKATIGRTAVVPSHFAGNISRDVARIRLGRLVRPRFLVLVFASHSGQKLLDHAVVGTTRAEVSIGRLQQLRLRYPEIAAQERIIAADDAISHRIAVERSCVAKHRSMRQALARDLLSGRVRTVAV
jgi:type I restriction enzyme S subunit